MREDDSRTDEKFDAEPLSLDEYLQSLQDRGAEVAYADEQYLCLTVDEGLSVWVNYGDSGNPGAFALASGWKESRRIVVGDEGDGEITPSQLEEFMKCNSDYSEEDAAQLRNYAETYALAMIKDAVGANDENDLQERIVGDLKSSDTGDGAMSASYECQHDVVITVVPNNGAHNSYQVSLPGHDECAHVIPAYPTDGQSVPYAAYMQLERLVPMLHELYKPDVVMTA